MSPPCPSHVCTSHSLVGGCDGKGCAVGSPQQQQHPQVPHARAHTTLHTGTPRGAVCARAHRTSCHQNLAWPQKSSPSRDELSAENTK